MREQPAAIEGGCDRFISDPLAGTGRRYRRGMDRTRPPEGTGQSAMDRGFELQRQTVGADPADRTHYFAAAAVLRRIAGDRRRSPALLRAAWNRRDCVFADEERHALRKN